MTVEPVDDEELAGELARIINAAYAIGEGGLWLPGTERIDEATVAGHIRAGEMLGAPLDGRIAGCARVHLLDPATGEVGLVSTDPHAWGHGIGRALVAAAEDRAPRARRRERMRANLLGPRDGVQPAGKQRLRRAAHAGAATPVTTGRAVRGRRPRGGALPHRALRRPPRSASP